MILGMAATAAAQPASLDVDVDVDVRVGPSAPPPTPSPPPHRLLELDREVTARSGDGFQLDVTVARGPGHVIAKDGSTWCWIASVAASRIDEHTPYYGHADELHARDTALVGTFGGAARQRFFGVRGGLGLGLERTTGTQTDFSAMHDVSRLAPVAELFGQFSLDFGPVTVAAGLRIIGHAQRYETIDQMDSFTREPTLLLFGGIAAALD